GYLYVPSHQVMTFENNNHNNDSRVFLYNKRSQPLEGNTLEVVTGNVNDMIEEPYEGMEEVKILDLITQDLAYVMIIHIFSFKPVASHSYMETHVEVHGAYVLSVRSMYNLDNECQPVDKGDYIVMGVYAPQATYAIG